jgi:hypothetical protein
MYICTSHWHNYSSFSSTHLPIFLAGRLNLTLPVGYSYCSKAYFLKRTIYYKNVFLKELANFTEKLL